MAKKKAAAKKKTAPKKKAGQKKKAASKKNAAGKSRPRVIDEPVQTVVYKLGDLIEGFEILEAAAARTKKKDPMPFDIQWETDDSKITLHVMGAVALTKTKK
jgi:hypothetical protein